MTREAHTSSGPLFSIVIPVYKVEKYLRQCVDSILAQDFSDYEIILVDDGSPDGCGAICDKYAELHPQITVIHKVNGGSSSARNAGVDRAVGQYVIFVDSDDFWDGREGLVQVAGCIGSVHPDMVVYGCSDFIESTAQVRPARGNYPLELNQAASTAEIVSTLLSRHNFPGAAWHLAVKRSLLAAHSIDFMPGVTAEDYDWLIKVFTHAGKVLLCNADFYRYRAGTPGSITSTFRGDSIDGHHNAIQNWFRTPDTKRMDAFKPLLVNIALQSLLVYANLDKGSRRHYARRVKENLAVLKLSPSRIYRAAAVAISMLGLTLSGNVLKSIYRLRKRLKSTTK